MKAIGYAKTGPIDAPDALIEFECDAPTVGDHDVLVRVQGVSVNPVDTKLRRNAEPGEQPRILGFDGAGTIEQVGAKVSQFQPGDEVYYAGNVAKAGSNAELQSVDERIVALKPKSLSFEEAAGMPLTALTAWELLFDSIGLREGQGRGQTLLITGAAGGVGSILIQLAKRLTQLTVVATASRSETIEWVTSLGADHVINHRESLAKQMAELGLQAHYVASLTATDEHFINLVELMAPRGRLALIDDPQSIDIKAAKQKAIALCWEFMFTRPLFNTDDCHVQQEILTRVARMLDNGALKSTVTKRHDTLTVEKLISAHAEQESGRLFGKQVFAGL